MRNSGIRDFFGIIGMGYPNKKPTLLGKGSELSNLSRIKNIQTRLIAESYWKLIDDQRIVILRGFPGGLNYSR